MLVKRLYKHIAIKCVFEGLERDIKEKCINKYMFYMLCHFCLKKIHVCYYLKHIIS